MKTENFYLRLSFITTFMFLCNVTFGQFQYKDWVEKIDIKQARKNTIWIHTLLKDKIGDNLLADSINQDTTLLSLESYNNMGLLDYKEGLFSHIDNQWYLYKHFRYDSINRLVEQVEYSNDSSWFDIYKIKYDDKNKSVKIELWRDNQLVQYKTWNYDKNGIVLSKVIYWGDGRIESKTIYQYDKKDKTIKTIEYKNDSVFDGFCYFKLDKNWNKLEALIYSKDSSLSQGHYRIYDKKGNLIQDKWVVDGGAKVRESITYKYDKSNRLLTVVEMDWINMSDLTKNYFYNKAGQVEYVISFDKNGTPSTKMVYQY